MEKKIKFLKTYANLPNATREDIIAVVDNEPYTWKSAKLEIEQETPIGQRILEVLIRLKILL